MCTSTKDNNVVMNGDIEDPITTTSFDQLVKAQDHEQAQDEPEEEIKVRNGGDNKRL